MKDIVNNLRENSRISENGLESLHTIAELDVLDFLKRFYKNVKSKNHKISKASIRAFAQTLHFHLPKAYEYVKQKISCALPDSRIIRACYSFLLVERT